MNFFVVLFLVSILLVIIFRKSIIKKSLFYVDSIIAGVDYDLDAYDQVNVSKDNPFYEELVKKKSKWVSIREVISRGL